MKIFQLIVENNYKAIYFKRKLFLTTKEYTETSWIFHNDKKLSNISKVLRKYL